MADDLLLLRTGDYLLLRTGDRLILRTTGVAPTVPGVEWVGTLERLHWIGGNLERLHWILEEEPDMSDIISGLPEISESDVDVGAVGLTTWLDSGEVFTGTPTITEVTSSDLTLGSKVVNTSTLTLRGNTYTAGQALQFSVSGQQAGTVYTIQITASTDASRTLNRKIQFYVSP